jgi:hypothetical protein
MQVSIPLRSLCGAVAEHMGDRIERYIFHHEPARCGVPGIMNVEVLNVSKLAGMRLSLHGESLHG